MPGLIIDFGSVRAGLIIEFASVRDGLIIGFSVTAGVPWLRNHFQLVQEFLAGSVLTAISVRKLKTSRVTSRTYGVNVNS